MIYDFFFFQDQFITSPHCFQLKKKLDSKDLMLKNLQFEEIYLQREIQKCHTFK